MIKYEGTNNYVIGALNLFPSNIRFIQILTPEKRSGDWAIFKDEIEARPANPQDFDPGCAPAIKYYYRPVNVDIFCGFYLGETEDEANETMSLFAENSK